MHRVNERQMALPFGGEVKKRGKVIVASPMQIRALEKIQESQAEFIIGVDEVGLGSWAGPVTVGAAVMRAGWSHPDVKDSKQLTPRKRERALQSQILPNALFTCTLWASPELVDAEGVDKAVKRLTASISVYCRHKFPSALIVQDGDVPSPPDGNAWRVIWMPAADALVPAVSAASIVAKVARDNYMLEMDARYPGYDFKSNAGYHSAKHVAGLAAQGACAIHRKSYKPVQRYMR